MPEISLTAELTTEIKKLSRSAQPTIVGVRQIARQLIVEATDATAAEGFFSKEQPKNDNESIVLTNTLNAARLSAWASNHFLKLAGDAEMAVCATLLADVALLTTTFQCPVDDARHASLSAAMVARIVDVPAGLTTRIARHHERSDGSGYPMRLTHAQLTRVDRLIALAVRFSELFNGDLTATLERLHGEARRGLFDAELSANLFSSMTGVLPSSASYQHRIASQWALTDLGRRRIRFDGAHERANRPHYDWRRSSNSRIATEIKPS